MFNAEVDADAEAARYTYDENDEARDVAAAVVTAVPLVARTARPSTPSTPFFIADPFSRPILVAYLVPVSVTAGNLRGGQTSRRRVLGVTAQLLSLVGG